MIEDAPYAFLVAHLRCVLATPDALALWREAGRLHGYCHGCQGYVLTLNPEPVTKWAAAVTRLCDDGDRIRAAWRMNRHAYALALSRAAVAVARCGILEHAADNGIH